MDERKSLEAMRAQMQEGSIEEPPVTKKHQRREALLQELEAYRAEAQEVPFEQSGAKEVHEKRIALAERRLEILEAKQDNTSALKGEYLGQELKTIFEEHGLTLDEEGHFEKDPALEQVQLLFVNLGELDRINQEGDHHSGDQALQSLYDQIEATIQEELVDMGEAKMESYEIYRTGGSKFSVKLDGVPGSIAERIRAKLDTSLDISRILPGKEPAPLAASRIGLEELTEVYDQLPEEEKHSLASDPNSSRIMIGSAFEMLNQLNDKRETETRLDRLIAKIKSGNEAEAEKFYTKFQARALTPMFSEQADRLLSYEEIKNKLSELGALENGTWADRKAEIALQEARRQFEARRLSQRDTERKVSEVAAKNYLEFQGGATETQARYIKQKESNFQEPKPTEGRRRINELSQEKEGLQERFREKNCPEHGSLDPECQELESVSAELDYERAIRDSMTGLKQRGPLFGTLESSLEQGEQISTVYIDMAFLKYFDKEGGRETGNLAILKAGEILDNVSQKFQEAGKRIEAYRIGGDEFAFSVAGEDEAFLKELLRELSEAQISAGEVPLKGDAPLGVYADQALVFNYGVFHTESKESMKTLLQESGLELEHEGTEKENNELAEYMLRFADKQLEIQKAVNRLQVLLQEGLAAEDLESGKYAQLVKYSEKAIFGAVGKNKLNDWRERLKATQESMKSAKTEDERRGFAEELEKQMSQIELEAIEFAIEQIRAKNEESENFEESIDKLIENHVRDKFLEQKISSLESEISSLNKALTEQREKNQELTQENATLKKRIALLEEEKGQIAALREKIRG